MELFGALAAAGFLAIFLVADFLAEALVLALFCCFGIFQMF